jgi:hypothetical protein
MLFCRLIEINIFKGVAVLFSNSFCFVLKEVSVLFFDLRLSNKKLNTGWKYTVETVSDFNKIDPFAFSQDLTMPIFAK